MRRVSRLCSRHRLAGFAKPVGWARAFSIPLCWAGLLVAQQPQEAPKLEPVKTSITVTEKISAETPANITVIDIKGIQRTPGVNMDDRLRLIPGFSLFRRSSSLVAHPTTQGISLRGIGSSGASRTLLLWDGVPANDPFGGWVYWTQFVPDDIASVEISRGAPTSVFGDRAMSGALGVLTREPERLRLFSGYQFGNRRTHDAWLGFSHVWNRLAVSGSGRAFTTDGYYIVPEQFNGQRLRGSADAQAGVRFVTGNVHIDRYTGWGNFFLKSSVLAEERKNGTNLTHNSTGLGTISLRYAREFQNDSVSVTGFHTREGFHSSFSSVPAGRNTETITFLQAVPAEATGGAALWQHHTSKWNLIGGADVNRAEGTSTDYLATGARRVGGGTQLQHGVFAQTDATLGPARFFAGLRHSFTGQDSRFLSPSAGAVLGRKSLRFRGSVFRAFRAPTLNELFREFRVGNTATLANANLKPETLFGVEAGVDWIGELHSLRLTGYRNSLEDLIANVTISSTPTLITRQRQNAAAAVSRGLEAEYRFRWRDWNADVQYLFVESRFATGLRIAQIPKHQGSIQMAYQHRGTMVTAGVRSYAYQFDDDLNTRAFRLPGYAVAQFVVRQRLMKSLSADLAIENAFNRTFYTAFTPTPNVGAPRLYRVGLRWDGRLR